MLHSNKFHMQRVIRTKKRKKKKFGCISKAYKIAKRTYLPHGSGLWAFTRATRSNEPRKASIL